MTRVGGRISKESSRKCFAVTLSLKLPAGLGTGQRWWNWRLSYAHLFLCTSFILRTPSHFLTSQWLSKDTLGEVSLLRHYFIFLKVTLHSKLASQYYGKLILSWLMVVVFLGMEHLPNIRDALGLIPMEQGEWPLPRLSWHELRYYYKQTDLI